MIFNILIVLLSALLWRVRGGLGERQGIEIPCNKIYYALFIGVINAYLHGWDIQDGIIGIIAAYTSYQLYGWGKYVGAVTGGNLNKEEKECELVDDLLNCETLYASPRLYGFFGTSLTGLIITFIIGLAFGELLFMVSGIGMGFCYWLGHIVCDYVKDDGKSGWNWGEWVFGAYLGLFICLMGPGL